MATVLNESAKTEIIRILRKQGYATYANLVDLFDIYLTDDPEVIGYMIPGKAKIVLNKNLSINQVSVIVRHEILHEYLTHKERQLRFEQGRGKPGDSQLANIAADYEISNKGYTDQDKYTVQHIIMGDQVLRGLVTEKDFPGWENMSFEEMYEKLLEEREQYKDQLEKVLNKLSKLDKLDSDDNDSTDNDDSDDNDSTGDFNNTEEGDDSSKSAKSKNTIDDAVDDLQDIEDNKGDRVFDTPEEQKVKTDIASRVAQIEKAFKDPDKLKDIRRENSKAKEKEKAAKAARDVHRYNTSPIHKFRLSLNQFIADEVGDADYSFAKPHVTYAKQGFIVPTPKEDEGYIPLINVYYDVSGSFSDARKTEAARQAIATLNEYVKRGQIKINVYYFGNTVSSTINGAGSHNTRGVPIQDHIAKTRPNNVIIVTDGDISDCHSVTTVPGAVWMLFYESRSRNVMEHIKGKKSNKYYDIEY